MRGSLRGRLGLALAGTAFLSVAVTSLVSLGLLRSYAEGDARADLRRVARGLAREGDGGDLRLPALQRLLRISGDELAVVVGDGSVLPGVTSAAGVQVAGAVDLRPLAGGAEVEGTVRVAAGEFAYVGVPTDLRRVPLRLRRQGIAGVVLARPLGLTRDIVGPVIARIALAAVAAVVAAVVASTLIARTLVRPVRELSAAASRIARGDLGQRVPVGSQDELGALGRSFNEMSSALSEAQRREREFLASVSHELKTPLTAIRGYAEAFEDGTLRTAADRSVAIRIIRAETDRLDRMVQDVMDLARLGALEFQPEFRDADLGPTLRDAVAAHGVQATEAGVTLAADLPEHVPARTDPDRVRQVVSNLVENALRVTAAGGTVRVGARASTEEVVIEVGDTGPGIAAEDLPHVFERSYLWHASKGARPVGTGLGLAIVRELVGVLGGSVAVSSEEGSGTTFRVTLPARGDA